jgi:hypothetical protein
MLTASLFCVIPNPSMTFSIMISRGWIGSIRSFSVVVDEFDIVCFSFSIGEADAPLGVHLDAGLTSTVTDQPLQTIPRRDPKDLATKLLHNVQHR